ncbi:MAG: flagellar hook-length control protein FliK, partial [Pseudomonadota bacterium]
ATPKKAGEQSIFEDVVEAKGEHGAPVKTDKAEDGETRNAPAVVDPERTQISKLLSASAAPVEEVHSPKAVDVEAIKVDADAEVETKETLLRPPVDFDEPARHAGQRELPAKLELVSNQEVVPDKNEDVELAKGPPASEPTEGKSVQFDGGTRGRATEVLPQDRPPNLKDSDNSRTNPVRDVVGASRVPVTNVAHVVNGQAVDGVKSQNNGSAASGIAKQVAELLGETADVPDLATSRPVQVNTSQALASGGVFEALPKVAVTRQETHFQVLPNWRLANGAPADPKLPPKSETPQLVRGSGAAANIAPTSSVASHAIAATPVLNDVISEGVELPAEKVVEARREREFSPSFQIDKSGPTVRTVGDGEMVANGPTAQLYQRVTAELANSKSSLQPGQLMQNPTSTETSSGPALKVLDVKLEPANLGTLSIRLGLKGENLSMHVGSSTLEAITILEAEKHKLTSALRASGYQIDDIVLQRAELEPARVMQSQQSSGAHDNRDPSTFTSDGENANLHDRSSQKGRGDHQRERTAEDIRSGTDGGEDISRSNPASDSSVGNGRLGIVV